jgi:uncharacterized RDD family membrane protein YckC
VTGIDDTAMIAPPGRRFSGFVVDVAVLVVLTLPLIPLTGGIDLEDVMDSGLPRNFLLAANILTAAYYILLTGWRGQTLGKMFVHTKVVGEDTGETPVMWQAVVRWVVPYVASSLPGFLSIAGIFVYGWILTDHRKQGLHDKAARTLVVQIGA